VKKTRPIIAIILAIVFMTGCAVNHELVKTAGISTRQDAFQEITSEAEPIPGYADLRIFTSLKTHKPGIYSSSDIHGTPDYKLLLNIDGQAVILRGSLQKENNEPMKLVDPEAGDGIRYRFSSNLRLRAGTHRIVVALPDDGIAVEREINLNEGKVNHLVLEPIYSSKPGKRRVGTYSTTGFMEGIRSIRLNLNERDI